MDSNLVDDIKNKLDIVDVISGYIRLQKAGRNYKATCPFHSEKSPSFMVSPERQLWKCFGCGKGGSIFDFVMEIEGIEFGDALKILAQRAGIELKKIDPKLKTERTRLYEICELANRFFIKQMEASSAGKEMQKYLIGRGLKAKTIKEWQIGYAPNQWRSLKDFLNKQGYPNQEISKTGLVIETEKNTSHDKYYDRFRDRIIFPIRDINGVAIGFTGRENPNNPDDRMGKYMNIPNTLLYDKSRAIYGLNKAKLEIKKKNLCILVEGQTDVIMSHQAGFVNVIASSGTALTDQQLVIIKRYTENLSIAFDTDLAGEMATKRGIDLALKFGFNTKVISLPDNQDPAGYIQKNPSLWEKAVGKAQDLIEFYLNNAILRNDPETVEGKKEISKSVLPMIKKISNKVEQAHWLQKTASKLKVQESVLIEEMEKIKDSDLEGGFSSLNKNIEVISSRNKTDELEEYVIGLLLMKNDNFKECKKEASYLFTDPGLEEIFKILKKSKGKKVNLKDLKKKIPSDLASNLDELSFKIEAQMSLTDEFDLNKEIKFCFNQLKKRYFHNKLNYLNLAIKEAEDKQNKSSIKKLTAEFNKLSKQMFISQS